ncbi:hypothetical protein [Gracilibacillus salinarum]|uniref:DUF4083 domain-containing protein n=1 Tax=Gracilibacillus salinarum TaxID=2932255 RepID=A0ABY4GJT2_9BACI|nr:hypothetical protein [Gracilibacillus salinarum]UOQ84608.1 hypothetical protein MUN87_18390 [Gracilibacillus salinarum]
MDLIEVLNLIIIAVIVLAIFTTFLLVFALKFAKSSNKQKNELIAMRKESLKIQKEILNEIKELRRNLGSKY